MGDFAELGPGGTAALHPVEFPELVDLARALIKTPRVVKAFQRSEARGMFRGVGGIDVLASLFTKGNARQLAATLAHEIGHLVDWLPTKTLKRGNLIGRLRSLGSFLKGQALLGDGTTTGPTNTTVRTELVALSKAWRPWDPTTATAAETRYRNSSRELYADALSVLLNDPARLQRDAPAFYGAFFAGLDAKPDVRHAYFDLQEVLSGTPEQLVERRRAGVRRMFQDGEVRAEELQERHTRERLARGRDLLFRLRHQVVDRNYRAIDTVRAMEKAGLHIDQDYDPRYLLEERNYLGGKRTGFVRKHFMPIFEAVTEAGIDWDTFGEALMYERISKGDRSEVANPRGLAPKDVDGLYAALQAALTSTQRAVLHAQMDAIRGALQRVADQGYEAGLYSEDLHTQMKANPAYVPFQVIEHMDKRITSRVHRQVGTLKDITNPATTTMLKALVTLGAIEHNRVKVETVAAFTSAKVHLPAAGIAIDPAKTKWDGRRHVPIDPPTDDGLALVTYYAAGKQVGVYVDPYLAESLNNDTVGNNFAPMVLLNKLNSHYFRPVFTTVNLGFQAFNVFRDFGRVYKIPGMTFVKTVQRYVQSLPMARARAFGVAKDARPRMQRARMDVIDAELAGILSATFNDLATGREASETQIEDIVRRSGLGGYGEKQPRTALVRGLTAVYDVVRSTGDFVETIPKAAGIIEYRGTGSIADITPAQRSSIRRRFGSPDFYAGGTWKPVTNNVLLFSNAIIQGWRADLQLATHPTTAGGWWWKTAKLNLVPKVLQAAALYGLFDALRGDEDDEETAPGDAPPCTVQQQMQMVPEYDRTNYIILPLGCDAHRNAVYVRVPQDDVGRFVGGVFWKALQLAHGDKDVTDTIAQVFDYTAGQTPGVAPIVETVATTAQFAAGQNPYDTFRGRHVLTDAEQRARAAPGGTTRALKKFIGWQFQQIGGGIVWKFYPGEQRPRAQTGLQKILDLPVISNVVGRFVRVTNYGEVEQLRRDQSKVAGAEDHRRLTVQEHVNDAIVAFQRLPTAQQTERQRNTLADAITDEIYDNPKERAAQRSRVRARMRVGVLRGEDDPLLNTVLSAGSNAQKVAIIRSAGERMRPAELETWLREAVRAKGISMNVYRAVREAEAEEEGALVGAR